MPTSPPDIHRDFTPAEIVRLHEANCEIPFAGPEEQNFRIALMKYIGRRLGLAELRSVTLTGPAGQVRKVPATPSPDSLP